MTRIGTQNGQSDAHVPGRDLGGQNTAGQDQGRRHEFGQRGDSAGEGFGRREGKGLGLGLGAGFQEKNGLPGGEIDARSDAFQRRLDQALGRQEPREDARDTAPEAVLLALATAAQESFRLVAVEATSYRAPVVSESAARVAALSERIEQAFLAELRGGVAPGAAIQISLGNLLPGLKGVVIQATAEGLDVTLQRDGEAASPALVEAARELAERLQARFDKRVVRVLDGRDAADEPASSGFAALSRLFGGHGSGGQGSPR